MATTEPDGSGVSPRRGFDRYMIQIGMGTNPKLADLSDAEFRAHIVGVLAIAAASPFRGALLVGDHPAEAKQIAITAGVPVKAVRSAVNKLCALGVLYEDDDLGCLRVHDWDEINPEPKSDPTNAERQQRYRDRQTALRNGSRNGLNAQVTA